MQNYHHKKTESTEKASIQRKTKNAAASNPSFDKKNKTVAQAKRQEIVKNSSKVSQLKSIQEMANNRFQQKAIVQKKENNTGLPNQLKSGIENLSGYSMDDVKVNYNSPKPAQLQAHAYAQGLEREADVMGGRAMRGIDLLKPKTQNVTQTTVNSNMYPVQRTIIKSLEKFHTESGVRGWDEKLDSLKQYLIKEGTGVGAVSDSFMGDVVHSIGNLRKTADPKREQLIGEMKDLYDQLGVILFHQRPGVEDEAMDARTKYNKARTLILKLTRLHQIAENIYYSNSSYDDQLDKEQRAKAAEHFPEKIMRKISMIANAIKNRSNSGLHKDIMTARGLRLRKAIEELRSISSKVVRLNQKGHKFREPEVFQKMQQEMDRVHIIVSSVADLVRSNKGDASHKKTNQAAVEDKVDEVSASRISDARNIGMIVTSTSGLLSFDLSPKVVFSAVINKEASNSKKLEDLGLPRFSSLTGLSTIASRADDLDHTMQDTEDFLIKVLRERVIGYVGSIGGGFRGDEIQVYLVGPQGPCNECAAKLAVWAIKTQHDINALLRRRFNDGKGSEVPVVGIRVKTKSLIQKSTEMRSKTDNIGHTYGSATSKTKETKRGVKYYSFDVVHNPSKAHNVKGPEDYYSGIF